MTTARPAAATVLLAALALWSVRLGAQPASPVVATDAGRLAGAVDPAGIRTFKGIPYAAPPIGALRWREPQPPAAWTGVRDAGAFGNRCMEAPFPPTLLVGDTGMSEDCLYLNVWAAAAAKRAPVLVWIHGGGLSSGYSNAAEFDGDTFARKGLVYVDFNYRVGAFGFLAYPALTAESPNKSSGNYGPLDQVAALQWVQRNIAAFGGDPANVTVFGQSAGAVSVSVLTASPLAHGLFKRAIGDSGAGLGSSADTLPVRPLAWAERHGVTFAGLLHATSPAELRAVPAQQIVDAGEHGPGGLFTGAHFGPVIEGYLLREPPERTFARGAQNDVALIDGWNGHEGILFQLVTPSGIAVAGCPPVWNNARTSASFAQQATASFGTAAPAFLALYPHATDAEAKASAEAVVGDLAIAWPTWTWGDLQARSGKTVAYMYFFDKSQPHEFPEPEAIHGSEVVYAFDNLGVRKRSWDAIDMQLAHTMSAYIVNFATTGNPNGLGLPLWPQYSAANPRRMIFDGNGAAAGTLPLARLRLIDANPSAGPWCPDSR